MIAMALVNNPKLLIADEPTTALDVTVQAQILTLMKDLQREYGSAIIIITHDLGVVADMADELLVMYGGKPVETGPVSDVFYKPEMPYTWGLLSSMPRMDKTRQERLVPITGTPPSLINLPPGCSFHPRCPDYIGDVCRTVIPPETLLPGAHRHSVRCHLYDD
jgi:peptide/nickel transport system ATP-binding protein